MTVWLIEQGESCEGGMIRGCFRTKQLALNYIEQYDLKSHGCDYTALKEITVVDELNVKELMNHDHKSSETLGLVSNEYV